MSTLFKMLGDAPATSPVQQHQLKESPLFGNTGKKIKGLAHALFLLDIIAIVVCCFVFGQDKYGEIDIKMILLILFGGYIISYMGCLLLYGFGKLVEKAEE